MAPASEATRLGATLLLIMTPGIMFEELLEPSPRQTVSNRVFTVCI